MAAQNRSRREPDERSGGSFETFKALAVAVLLALAIRSFVIEPFKIPSGSMIPTLLVGDYLVVNKFLYGLRLPVNGQLLLAIEQPERGDVMVFRYPDDPSQDFIKRVIGLPGDRIEMEEGRVRINGRLVDRVPEGEYSYVDFRRGRKVTVARYREINPEGVEYTIIHQRPPRANRSRGPWIVPPGEYFMMGDNRDNSRDSREWSDPFVRVDQIKGKAFMVHGSWIVSSEPGHDRGFLMDFLYTLYRAVTFQIEEIRWGRIGRSVPGVAD